MPPQVALAAWFVLLVLLLRFDPAHKGKTSFGLWVPVLWFSIIGSRLPSQWLGLGGGQAARMMEEGNALDRYIYFALIFAALYILSRRSFSWMRLAGANMALTSILILSLMSVLWSDFPFVSFKRWFRDLGLYLAILVAITDPSGLGGIRMLLRRTLFLLIPLSIVVVKYFPDLGKDYDVWTGQGYFIGVTTSKNMLGVLCLVSGLFFIWDTLTLWQDRESRHKTSIAIVNAVFLSMTLWLLSLASSATSSVCLILGGVILIAAQTKAAKRHPALLAVSIPLGIGMYALLEFVAEVNIIGTLAQFVGRNPDLTGRTRIWSVVLSAGTNPMLGAGYESFWLGPRLEWVWQHAGLGQLNEAHNGFLEVYLTLGAIGVCLYLWFLMVSYFRIFRKLWSSSDLASLSLALWTVLVFYNVTESAFKSHLLWVTFLLGVIILPEPAVALVNGARKLGVDRPVRRAPAGKQTGLAWSSRSGATAAGAGLERGKGARDRSPSSA